MRETLEWQKILPNHHKGHIQKSAQGTDETQNSIRGTNVRNNETEHIQNSAQNTNITKNLTEHIPNNARGTNVPSNHTKHI